MCGEWYVCGEWCVCVESGVCVGIVKVAVKWQDVDPLIYRLCNESCTAHYIITGITDHHCKESSVPDTSGLGTGLAEWSVGTHLEHPLVQVRQ